MGGKRKGGWGEGGGKRQRQGGGGGGGRSLAPGMQGVCFTIDPYKEGQAMKEIRGLMERYVEAPEEEAGGDDAGDDDLGDIAGMLQAELQAEKKKPQGIGNFVATGCRGNLFYRIPDKEKYPADEVVRRITVGLRKSGLAETRFVYKMQPIYNTAPAHMEAIERELSKRITAYIETVPNTPTTLVRWSVVWSKKSCSDKNLDRVLFADSIQPLFSSHRFIVDLRRPETAVIVSIFKTVACLGLAADYQEFCEYNIHKLTRKEGEGAPAATPAAEAATPAGGAAASAEDVAGEGESEEEGEGGAAEAVPEGGDGAQPASDPAVAAGEATGVSPSEGAGEAPASAAEESAQAGDPAPAAEAAIAPA